MANLNLKGLWIPIEILTDKNLSDKENNNCFCTNGTISELLNISSKQVSKLINSLKAKGYIGVTMKYKENSKQIKTRTIKPIQEKLNTSPSKVIYPSPTKVPYHMEQKVTTMNSEIMIKKALIGIVYMQIIILHRRYAIKQNESVGFVKSKTYAFILEF